VKEEEEEEEEALSSKRVEFWLSSERGLLLLKQFPQTNSKTK
jgi:hypothetical protein